MKQEGLEDGRDVISKWIQEVKSLPRNNLKMQQ